MPQTFYFNTGVKCYHNTKLYGIQVNRGGVVQIPVVVSDIPEGHTFMHASNEDHVNNAVRREILNRHEKGSLLSKYAWFKPVRQ